MARRHNCRTSDGANGGKTRVGLEADLSELRDPLLRFDARAGGLPEMQHAVRPRSISEITAGPPPPPPRAEEGAGRAGAEELNPELKAEEADAAEEEEEAVPIEEAEEEDEEL